MDGFESKVQSVWRVAVPEETERHVLTRAEQLEGVTDDPDVLLPEAADVPACTTRPLTFGKLLDSPDDLAQQPDAFSPRAPLADAVQEDISTGTWQDARRNHDERAA